MKSKSNIFSFIIGLLLLLVVPSRKDTKVLGFMDNLLLAVVISVAIAPFLGAPTLYVTGVIIALGFLTPSIKGASAMAIQKEVWAKDIEENIYPDNSFYLQSKDDSDWVEGNKVHTPEAGTAPSVQKNRAALPATVSKRIDSDYTYSIDEYTTDPIVLQKTEEVEVSYNKRQSILFDHTEKLRTEVAENMAYNWAPSIAANLVRTTGTARAAYEAGQTGNRKAIVEADIIELNRILDRMDVSKEGRFLGLPANLQADLLKIDRFTSLDKIGSAVALQKGVIGMIMGFQVYVRSTFLRYDNSGTPVVKAVGSAVAAADNLACLAWHKSFVRRALGKEGNGGIEIFMAEKDPTFYGDVFSALVRAGGKKVRNDQKGVLALIETAA